MKINMVLAASENNVIGKDNKLLWCLPNDMKFFKNTTWAMPVIMGRKTYESLGKPLKGRINIVITSNQEWKADNVIVTHSLDAAIKAGAATDVKELYIIGGGEIYRQAMPIADRIYLTRVHGTFDGDTYFPEMKKEDWSLFSRLDFPVDKDHDYAYSFEVWDRVKPGI
ncbi:dihydrofolate reductase [Flavihumibacter petaseus]|uniref:Dihydrofolate reductase n=1 Tax=Flavihumibacter petaseus NBRC 106054 TaxID=1220578 RepID=A0A0E9MZY7_9BACT|nr:dihydrofolate reductase [Flavihumibacter petaseus]GAO42941.1 dihydrofolate reductase [Flavihumibacter petaseus NBRC 106054]